MSPAVLRMKETMSLFSLKTTVNLYFHSESNIGTSHGHLSEDGGADGGSGNGKEKKKTETENKNKYNCQHLHAIVILHI